MPSTFFAFSRAATKHQPLASTQMLEAGSVSEEFLGLLEDAVYAGHSILPIHGGADFIDLVEAWKTKGKKLSAAHRKAISDALKGKKKGGAADDDSIPGAVKAAASGFNAKKAKPGDTVQTPDGPAKITKVHGQAWVQVEGAKKKWYKSSELSRPSSSDTPAAKPTNKLDAMAATLKKNGESGIDVPAAKKLPHADELTIEHGLGGSTGAKLAKDADGNQYVIKYGASKEHAAAEAAANNVYAAMGVKVPKGHLDKDGAVVNEFLAGGVALANVSGMARSDAYKQLGQHFVLDAVLGNRDVVGPDKMNVLVKDGVAYRIDNGSTFDFRAQGLKKEFTANVVELASLRDPKINPATAEVYKHLTDSDIRKQALELHTNRQKILDATPEQYRKVVSDRIDDVLAKTGATAPQTTASAASVVSVPATPTPPTSTTKTSGQNGLPIGAGDTVQYQGTSKKRYSVVSVDPKDGALTLKDHATGNIVADMNPMSFNKVNSSAAAVTPKMTVDSDPAKGQAMPANKVTALHKKSEILAAHPVGSKIITANGTELTVTGATTGYVETTGGSKKYYKLTDLASEGATHGAKVSTTPSAAPSVATTTPSVATGPKYKTKNGTELEVGDEITTPLLTKYKVLAVNADGSATLQKTADLVDPNGPDVGKITHNVPAGKLADDTAAGITKSVASGPKATLASGETVGAGDTVHFGPSQYKVTQVHDDGSTTMQVVKAASTEKVGDTFKIHPQDAGLYADSVTPATTVPAAPTKPAHKVGDWVDTADGPAKITAIGSDGYPQFTNPKTGIPDTTHPDNVTPIKAKTFMAPSGSVTHLKQYHPVGSIISTPDGDFKVAKHYTGYVGVEGAPKKNYKIEDLKTHAATTGSTVSSTSSAVPAAAFKNAAGAAVLSKSGSHVKMGDTLQTKTGATYEVVGQTADGKISLKHTKSGKVYDNDPGYVTNFMTHAPGSSSAPSPAAPSAPAVSQAKLSASNPPPGPVQKAAGSLGIIPQGLPHAYQPDGTGPSLPTAPKKSIVDEAAEKVTPAPGHVSSYGSIKYDADKPPAVGQAVYHVLNNKAAVVDKIDSSTGAKIAHVTYSDGTKGTVDLGGGQQLKAYDAQKAKTGGYSAAGASDASPFTPMPGWPTKYVKGENTKHDPTWIKQQNAAVAMLPESQKTAIKNYTGSAFSTINDTLRLEQTPTAATAAKIKALDQAMANARTDRDIIVYRGIGTDIKTGKPVELKVGEIFTDKGYMSTSVSKGSEFSGSTKFEILLPTGSRAIYAKAVSSYPHEDELLVGRNTRFIVHEIIQKGYERLVRMEALVD